MEANKLLISERSEKYVPLRGNGPKNTNLGMTQLTGGEQSVMSSVSNCSVYSLTKHHDKAAKKDLRKKKM